MKLFELHLLMSFIDRLCSSRLRARVGRQSRARRAKGILAAHSLWQPTKARYDAASVRRTCR